MVSKNGIDVEVGLGQGLAIPAGVFDLARSSRTSGLCHGGAPAPFPFVEGE
jgi:hypothetical protein